MHLVVIMGTAGCGKSTLTSSLESFVKDHGLDVITVNLDPAARRLPYNPYIDVRDFIDIGEIMNQLGLGPNGALVAAVDMAAGQIDRIKESIEDSKAEYAIVDTPGQMELFAYRSTGPLIVSALAGKTTINLHLLDPNLARHPSGYVSLALLGASLQHRFTATQFNLLAKSDLLSGEEIERIVLWSTDPAELYKDVDGGVRGVSGDVSKMICELLERVGLQSEVIPVSAESNEGLENLYAHLERIWGTEIT